MKNLLLILSIIYLLTSCKIHKTESTTDKTAKGRISISGAWALYPMAIKWAEEYMKINPGIRIDISAGGAGKGLTDAINNMIDIGMVSREIHPDEIKKGAFPIAVTKDAVVPTISSSNPLIKTILTKGLKKETAYNIWINGKIKTWGPIIKTNNNTPVNVYTRSDACGAAEVWANYLGKDQEDLLGIGVFGDPGIALAVKNDFNGIGYNNIAYVFDMNTKKINSGIAIIPLDLNNNDTIEENENFYNTIEELTKAIETDKYPSPPARNLYFVTNKKPSKKIIIDFIYWILTDGQKYIDSSGYIKLSPEKIKSQLELIK